MKKLLLFVLTMGCCTLSTNAATVTFTLDLEKLGTGNFEVRAQTSAGDNGGLALFSVALTDVATVNHNSLRNNAAENADGSLYGPVGYTLFRTADDTNPAVGPAVVHGAQDMLSPTPFLIYEMGQTAGDLASRGIVTYGSKEGDPWAADMVIATGTYLSGQLPAFEQGPNVLTLANTFNAVGSPTNSIASIQTLVISPGGERSFAGPNSPAPVDPPAYSPPIDETPPAAPVPTPVVAPPAPRPRFDPFANVPHSPADIPVSVEFTRRSRPVADHEIAGGAPDGYVHEFFVTSTTDVIGIQDVEIDVALFQHKFNVDYQTPNAKALKLFPAVSADSFLDTPGQTDVLGGYANTLGKPDTVWFDRTNSGPQNEFLFARLTVGETGSFSGTVSVAGPSGAVDVPFSFVLPGTADDFSLLDGEASIATANFTAVPEPAAWLLAVAAHAVVLQTRRRLTSVRRRREAHYFPKETGTAKSPGRLRGWPRLAYSPTGVALATRGLARALGASCGFAAQVEEYLNLGHPLCGQTVNYKARRGPTPGESSPVCERPCASRHPIPIPSRFLHSCVVAQRSAGGPG